MNRVKDVLNITMFIHNWTTTVLHVIVLHVLVFLSTKLMLKRLEVLLMVTQREWKRTLE